MKKAIFCFYRLVWLSMGEQGAWKRVQFKGKWRHVWTKLPTTKLFQRNKNWKLGLASCQFFDHTAFTVEKHSIHAIGIFSSQFCNYSQTKFVAIILVLWSFLMQIFALPIFRLTLIIFRPQNWDKQVKPSRHWGTE